MLMIIALSLSLWPFLVEIRLKILTLSILVVLDMINILIQFLSFCHPDVNHVKAEFWYSENSDCSFRILTDDEVPKNTLFGCDATPAATHGKFVYVSTDVISSSKVFLLPPNTRLDLNVIFQSFYDPSVKLFKTYQVETLNGKLNVKDLSVKNNTNVLSSMDLIIIIVGSSALGLILFSVLCYFLFFKYRCSVQETGGAPSTAPAHSLGAGTEANSNNSLTPAGLPGSAAPGHSLVAEIEPNPNNSHRLPGLSASTAPAHSLGAGTEANSNNSLTPAGLPGSAAPGHSLVAEIEPNPNNSHRLPGLSASTAPAHSLGAGSEANSNNSFTPAGLPVSTAPAHSLGAGPEAGQTSPVVIEIRSSVVTDISPGDND